MIAFQQVLHKKHQVKVHWGYFKKSMKMIFSTFSKMRMKSKLLHYKEAPSFSFTRKDQLKKYHPFILFQSLNWSLVTVS